MDINKETQENIQNHLKLHNDLLKLIRVLDDCIENSEQFYCYAFKRRILTESNNN